MAYPGTVPHPAVQKLQNVIAELEEILAILAKNGHVFTDAERRLRDLKDRRAYLLGDKIARERPRGWWPV